MWSKILLVFQKEKWCFKNKIDALIATGLINRQENVSKHHLLIIIGEKN